MQFIAKVVIILLLLDSDFCYYIQHMNSDNQIAKYSLVINDQDYSTYSDQAFSYGLWSRYTPLSQITQVGKIGILDSTCFHYHNAAEKVTKNINFIYYDCLDYPNMQITKYVKFIDDSNQEHVFSIQINQYEYTWYYFQIIQWPQVKRFQLTLLQYPNIILQQELTISYPYFDKNLDLTFGGGSNGQYNSQLVQYSYFPGTLVLYALDKTRIISKINVQQQALNSFYNLVDCFCEMNFDGNIVSTKLFQNKDLISHSSSYPNCDYFQIAGWIRITDIFNVDNEFSYRILKVTTDTQNSKLQDDNLSPFILSYHISSSENKIVFTTYSFTFPSVNVDFSTNPYLITNEFKLNNNLKLWHFFDATLSGEQLVVQITFYEGSVSHFYSKTVSVNQFHMVAQNIQVGNLKGSLNNYLNFEANQIQYTNCEFFTFSSTCNEKCSTCDGPTEFDCITCSPGRIYLTSQKTCVCSYNALDQSDCLTMKSLNLKTFTPSSITQCNYGEFNANEKCIKCPTSVNQQQIGCVECLNNPKTWVNTLYCQFDLISEDGKTYQEIESKDGYYFTFDGSEITYCESCTSNCINDSCLFNDQSLSNQILLCSSEINENCQLCDIPYCQVCSIQNNLLQCQICESYTNLSNGKCEIKIWGASEFCFDYCAYCVQKVCQSCYPPYYITSDRKQCKVCPIKNCLYCFQFQENDLTQSTLYQQFTKFEQNEYTKLGCSKCNDGFNYDFTSGECIYRQSSINNCLNYFINLQGQEICLLSSVSDFSVAPQIIGCQVHIQKCEQCLLTPSQAIKCIICEDGYRSSAETGHCELCTIPNALVCIDGNFNYYDAWVQLIQSFLIQFLPDSYYYPKSTSSYFITAFPIKCIDGYQPNFNFYCKKFCDSDCLNCIQDLTHNTFTCQECPLSYYGAPNLSVDVGTCLTCPLLCLACQPRTQTEIQQINPYFVSSSSKYSYKCYRAIEDQNIKIDQELLVASYCYDNDCSRSFEYQLALTCFNIQNAFLTSFDSYYEKSINTKFCNQMGIKNFLVRFLYQADPYQKQCVFGYETNMQNQLKANIFSLQNTQLIVAGNNKTQNIFPAELNVNNFDVVQFQDMIFQVISKNYFRIKNYDQPVNLMIQNTMFYGVVNQIVSYSINVTLNKDLQLKNITIINLWLKDTTFLEYHSNFDENFIDIYQINIFNCSFENSTLFSFTQYSKDIKIQEIEIYNSTFINSSIIKYNSSYYNVSSYLTTLLIRRNTFQSTILFNDIGCQMVNIKNLYIINNTFYESIVMETSLNAILQKIQIVNNQFILSIFFKAITQSVYLQSTIYTFDRFTIEFNQFINSSLLYIHQVDSDQNPVSIQLTNFQHQSLINSDIPSKSITFLYDFECQYLFVSNCSIFDSTNLPYFRIFYTYTAKFENILFKQTSQAFKVSASSKCFEDMHNSPILLHIQGFSSISLHNITIINQFSIDYSLIHILSDILYLPSDQETLKFSDIKFQGNLLLKNNLGSIFSLFVVYSDRKQYIKFDNINFEENFFNQLVDDPSLTTAGLLFINSQQSSVEINQITCLSNGLTNSSYSFITINSLYSNFNNFYVTNSNYLSNQIWLKYYQIETDFQVINEIIQQIFKIEIKGGVGQFASSTLVVTNSVFKNLIAQSNSVFSITTQGQGIIKIMNVSIYNASAILSQTIEVDGCISIYSKSSLLHLTMQNIYMESIKNRQGSAILTIYPSQKVNIINLTNLTAFNCISLMNQFITAEFTQDSAPNNFIVIQQLNITYSEIGWSQYLKEITFPSIAETKKILSENAIINIHDCSFTFVDFYISGLIISPIMILTDIQKLIMNNIRVLNVQVFYPFRVFQFIQTKSAKHQIIFNQLTIQNTTQIYQSSIMSNQLSQIFIAEYVISNCAATNIVIISQDVNQTINLMINQLTENYDQEGSLIFINGVSSYSKVQIKHVNLFNNNCTFCYDGMLHISSVSAPAMTIENINCYFNHILQYGCISIIAEQPKKQSFTTINLKKSYFIKNYGTSGVGLYASNILMLTRNLFLQNKGSQKGGAIFTNNISNNFIIIDTFIIENQADAGGGIFFSGDNYITSENFVSSLNIFNKAFTYSDNLVEVPDHLVLSINSKEMISKEFNNSNYHINQLQIKPYKCIQQGKIITSSDLLLPSSQQISNYKFFNPKKQNFDQYIGQFSLFYKNSMNEILTKDQGQCELLARNFSLKSDQSQENFTKISQFNYDTEKNSFDLSSLVISFDPYSDNIMQLQFICSKGIESEQLYYQMNVKTLKCQLGEFYVSGGCQICEPSYGFYSVQYDATKCSIFDKTKFQNITSNQIQLLNGKWRPYHQSDLIEDCFKNIKWCVGGWGVGNDLCYIGHIGGLCEECDIYNIQGDGYYQKTNSLACIICNNSIETLLPFIFITLWSLIATLLTLKSIKNTNKVFAILKTRTKLFEIVFKLTQDFESILLKMLLNYLWIFSVIFTFNITFAFSFSFVDQVSNPSFFMATNLDCQLSRLSSFQLVYIRIITMILLMMIQIVFISTGFFFLTYLNQSKYDFGIISNTVIYLFISNLAALIKNFGSLIAVRQISNIDYIQGNVALQFYEKQHIQWILAFILPGLVIFGILIPFTLFLILFLSKKRFNQSVFRKYFGYLFNEYNRETYYWEQIKIWKKSILIILMTYFETSIYVKAALINLTLLCYQVLAVNNKPYILNSLNKLDVESGQIVSIAIFLAIVKFVSEQDQNDQVSMLLQVIIIIFCIRLFYAFLFNIGRVYVKKYKTLFLSSLHHLSSKIKADSFLTLSLQKHLSQHKLRKQLLQMNYEKLRQCLITISKIQLEQQKKIISLTNPMPSNRHSRLFSELETNRMATINKTSLLTKEDK